MKLHFMPLRPGCNILADTWLNLLITWDLSPSAHERQEGDRWPLFWNPFIFRREVSAWIPDHQAKAYWFSIWMIRFPVSCRTCEESHHFHLYCKKKSEPTKTQLFSDASEKWGHRENQKDRQADTEHHNSHEQKHTHEESLPRRLDP